MTISLGISSQESSTVLTERALLASAGRPIMRIDEYCSPRYAPADHAAREGVDDQSQVRSSSPGRGMEQVRSQLCTWADAGNCRFTRSAGLSSATSENVVLPARPRTGSFSPNSLISRRTIQRAIATLSRLNYSQTLHAP